MDVGTTNGWRLDEVVPAAEVVETIGREWPLEAVDAGYRGEVAERWRYADGRGEIGVIASVTQPFCGDCTRARLSAEGKLYTCLFSAIGHDLRAPLRGGARRRRAGRAVAGIWAGRDDRYSERRAAATDRLPEDRDVRPRRSARADRGDPLSTVCPQRCVTGGQTRTARPETRG